MLGRLLVDHLKKEGVEVCDYISDVIDANFSIHIFSGQNGPEPFLKFGTGLAKPSAIVNVINTDTNKYGRFIRTTDGISDVNESQVALVNSLIFLRSLEGILDQSVILHPVESFNEQDNFPEIRSAQ
jgi:hypothetical protein